VEIRDARRTEVDVLTALAVASKASWGYDDDFMAACRDELTVRPDDLDGATVRVAIEGNTILGFAATELDGNSAELTALFVAPDAMRRGVGRALLRDATHLAKARGARHIRIEADPNAVAFYTRAGARHVGEVPSQSIPGRVLPLLELAVG
jgi:ribosomal protein S18 acetylase RimI-like enzyme